VSFTRRQLIRRGSAAGAGTVALGLGLGSTTPAAANPPGSSRNPRLFPPLSSEPGDLLALPAGFSYHVVAVAGQTDIHDGSGTLIGKTPERVDGTLAIGGSRRGYLLIQNHEIGPTSSQPVPHVTGTEYDPGVNGGCTVVDVTRDGQRRSEWVGLSGTYNNCAGGPTPWGSWLSCEESEARAGIGTLTKDHGYVFEIFAGPPADQTPLPITAWGRAAHEAVVIEPGGSKVYLTEDASSPNGLLYRWTGPEGYHLKPHIARSLGANDGRLEALVVLAPDGSILPDLAYVTAAQIGRPFATKWTPVPDRQASSTSLRKQFADGTVTRSKKLEGAWGDRDGLYFVASFAFAAADLPVNATKHDGQLWRYDYRAKTLTLVAYFPYNAILHSEPPGWESTLAPSLDLAYDGPDGCHVSPYGSLVLTEDGNTANHVLSWSATTGAQAIARNLIVQEKNARGGNVYSEMTGPCFSPDGRLLFSNVHEPGHTFSISGPWRHYLG
jgi:uncharacterized protein